MSNSENFNYSDKPAAKDRFSVKERFVDRIYDLIKNSDSSNSFTIAITGEWGSGKTTAMNFLREEIKNEFTIIEFEPLLEKKFEIDEIMESFYLKLYSSMDKKSKNTIKKLFKSLLILSRSKFENLVCVICIDYERVMEKLIREGKLGLGNYNSAQSYLDKLFQYKIHIHHRIDQKLQFAFENLPKSAKEMIEKFKDTSAYINEFQNVITYLSTIRQIKKWLSSIHNNYYFIDNLPKEDDFHLNMMAFFGFVALTVKHPVIIENITKNIESFLMFLLLHHFFFSGFLHFYLGSYYLNL